MLSQFQSVKSLGKGYCKQNIMGVLKNASKHKKNKEMKTFLLFQLQPS